MLLLPFSSGPLLLLKMMKLSFLPQWVDYSSLLTTPGVILAVRVEKEELLLPVDIEVLCLWLLKQLYYGL